VLDQLGHTLDKHARLPGAGWCEHPRRSTGVLHGTRLARVERLPKKDGPVSRPPVDDRADARGARIWVAKDLGAG
jgi:hypothetical protein